MKIYIDSDFKCHTMDDGTMTAAETAFFDGKCQTFVEGYRFVPSGESWTRSDGIVFRGEMVAPWKNYAELEAAQQQYEQNMADLQEAYRKGVNSV
jgi:hypothetical protein